MFARRQNMPAANPTGRGVGSKKVEAPVKAGNGKTAVPKPRRAVFGDVTNAVKEQIVEDGKKNITGPIKPKQTKSKVPIEKSRLLRPATKKENKAGEPKANARTEGTKAKKQQSIASSLPDHISSSQESAASDKREEESFSFIEESDELEAAEKSLVSFDQEMLDDPFHVGLYAQDIFDYYKRRELLFKIPPTLGPGMKQCHITPTMRSILVDWLVEIQENFELNHETLYLAVKLTDLYLSRVELEKEMLQLLGAAAIFISAKFDERCPPLIEDFTYICDNAFDRSQFIEMEMEVLRKIDFDLGIPISYRFLRRYAKVDRVPMETLTLARFILEMSLMEYDLVNERDSMIAAASLHIAKMMRLEGAWDGEVVKSSGYTLAELRPLVEKLNAMLLAQPSPHLQNIRCKYTHIVFHEVAKIPALKTVDLFL